MIAGKLNSKIRIYRPVTQTNKLGETVASWQPVGDWHAQRVLLSGTYGTEADDAFADYRAKYNIRIEHQPRPQPGWRLDGDDGLLYEVTAVLPNKPRGMLTLECQRVNL